METPPAFQSSPDLEHLKLLEIFHYVMMGLAVIGMAFIAMHYALMSSVFDNPHMWDEMQRQAAARHQPPPPFDPRDFFHIFRWFYLLYAVWSIASLIANCASGICLRRKTNRMFSLIVAGFNCINIPFGTVLGIFTIIVLVRPSVLALYQNSKSS